LLDCRAIGTGETPVIRQRPSSLQAPKPAADCTMGHIRALHEYRRAQDKGNPRESGLRVH